MRVNLICVLLSLGLCGSAHAGRKAGAVGKPGTRSARATRSPAKTAALGTTLQLAIRKADPENEFRWPKAVHLSEDGGFAVVDAVDYTHARGQRMIFRVEAGVVMPEPVVIQRVSTDRTKQLEFPLALRFTPDGEHVYLKGPNMHHIFPWLVQDQIYDRSGRHIATIQVDPEPRGEDAYADVRTTTTIHHKPETGVLKLYPKALKNPVQLSVLFDKGTESDAALLKFISPR